MLLIRKWSCPWLDDTFICIDGPVYNITCLISWDKCRLSVFENIILRQIFGPQRDENKEWRRLHNEELHNLYHSPNIVKLIKSRRLKWASDVAKTVEGSSFRILTNKLTGKRLLGTT